MVRFYGFVEVVVEESTVISQPSAVMLRPNAFGLRPSKENMNVHWTFMPTGFDSLSAQKNSLLAVVFGGERGSRTLAGNCFPLAI